MARQEIISRTISGLVTCAIAWYWKLRSDTLTHQHAQAGNGLLRHWAMNTPRWVPVYSTRTIKRRGRKKAIKGKTASFRLVQMGEQIFRPYIDNLSPMRNGKVAPRGLIRNYAQKLLKRNGVANYDWNILDDIAQEASYLHFGRMYPIHIATFIATQRYMQMRRGRETMVKVAGDTDKLARTLPLELTTDKSVNEIALLELSLDFPELFKAIDGNTDVSNSARWKRTERIKKKVVAALFNNDVIRYNKAEIEERAAQFTEHNEVRERRRTKRKSYAKVGLGSVGLSINTHTTGGKGCFDSIFTGKRIPEFVREQFNVAQWAEENATIRARFATRQLNKSGGETVYTYGKKEMAKFLCDIASVSAGKQVTEEQIADRLAEYNFTDEVKETEKQTYHVPYFYGLRPVTRTVFLATGLL